MAEQILISIPEMEAAVAQYTAQKDAKLDAIEQMNNAVKTMDGSWDGPASQAFMAAFQALYNNLMTSESIMQDAIDELNRFIERSKAVEDAQTNTSSNLDPGASYGV